MSITSPTESAPDAGAMADLFAEYGAAWASHDADRIAAFHAADGVFHLHADAGEPVTGKDAIRETFAAFLAQFPDLAFEEQSVNLADWGWAVRWTMSGTLAGALEVDGAEARQGSRISVDAMDVIEVEGGLVTAKHTYLDAAELMRQMGVGS